MQPITTGSPARGAHTPSSPQHTALAGSLLGVPVVIRAQPMRPVRHFPWPNRGPASCRGSAVVLIERTGFEAENRGVSSSARSRRDTPRAAPAGSPYRAGRAST